VGLLSPRSIKEIIDRLTPLFVRELVERQSCAARNSLDPRRDALVQARAYPPWGIIIHHS